MGTQVAYTWVPSSARLVAIDGFCLAARGTPLGTPPALCWPAKDPGDTLDFVVDISGAICGNEGDSIATIDVSITPANPGDLTLQSSSADGGLAILWLTGGIVGVTYQVSVTIATNSGRVIGRTISLPVWGFIVEAPAPPEALTDQTGAPITDQMQTPILVTD